MMLDRRRRRRRGRSRRRTSAVWPGGGLVQRAAGLGCLGRRRGFGRRRRCRCRRRRLNGLGRRLAGRRQQAIDRCGFFLGLAPSSRLSRCFFLGLARDFSRCTGRFGRCIELGLRGLTGLLFGVLRLQGEQTLLLAAGFFFATGRLGSGLPVLPAVFRHPATC